MIIDDLGVQDPPLVCLFSVQNITKKIKAERSEHLHIQSRALEQGVKSIQSYHLRLQGSANFIVLVSSLLTLNIFYTLF